MARSKRQIIEVNNNNSLQSVMQEVYNNACNQMNDAQKVVNEVSTGATPEDVDDWAKLAKSKTDALKLKDSAIKIKLDIGKLQSDIIKYGGNMSAVVENNSQLATSDNFSQVREMIKKREEEAAKNN
jgi:hypothetical protein